MLILVGPAACGGDDDGAGTAGPGPTPTSASSSASGCALVGAELVRTTFKVNASLDGAPTSGAYRDGKEYKCRFEGPRVWSLSVTSQVFTAPISADDLVGIGVTNAAGSFTKVAGVGDGAAYAKVSSLLQFVAVKKDGDKATLVILLGTSGDDDEKNYSAIAAEVLKNTPG